MTPQHGVPSANRLTGGPNRDERANRRRKTRKAGCAIDSLESRLLLAVTPLITEFMASNSLQLDIDGDSSDWLEIHNPSTSALNLDGYYLTADPARLLRWRLPAQTIAAGGYLQLWASGKNRAVVGSQLHTDFTLDADGGYLALLAADTTPVHEYASYPQQLTNVSYGLSVQRDEDPLIGASGTLTYRIPTGPMPADWTARDFAEAGWTAGAAGLGYDTETTTPQVPGFGVRMVDTSSGTIANIGVATTLLNGNTTGFVVASNRAANSTVINYGDTGSFTAAAQRLPNDPNGLWSASNSAPERERFALRITANVVIPANTYTINVGSDDGFRLTIPGVTFAGRSGENFTGATNPSPADTLVYGGGRGHGNTFANFTVGAGGLSTTLQLDYFDGGGGDSLELSLALTARTTFSTSTFSLLSNGTHGWQITSPSVTPVPSLLPLIATNVQATMKDVVPSAFIRAPFALGEGDGYESVRLRVNYDDGFIAYINGQEIAWRNAPETPVWNSTATISRPDDAGLTYEDITVDLPEGLLVEGANVLAIQGLNSEATSTDFLIYPQLTGLGPAVVGERYFTTVTAGGANPTSDFTGRVADTTFSHDRGFYDTAFNLVIATDTPGAQIRYTLDGSAPTATTGLVYNGALSIAGTTTLRAAALKPGLISSDVDTQTYLFVDDVPNQTSQWTLNRGFPAMWGTTTPDYGMDNEVVGPGDLFGGVYAASIRDDLKAVPTLSIVMKTDDLFGASGIYTNSTAAGIAWERATSVELLYPDGGDGFQMDAGIRIQGGAFRDHSLTKKHSLRLLFKNQYGAGKLDFPFFDQLGAVDSFDTLTLRANNNDGWQWGSAGGKPLYARDEFGRRTQLATGNAGPHGNFMHVYINGVYWGMFNPVERPDAAFAASYYGGAKENWDAINSGIAVDGNLTAWNTLLTLCNDVANGADEAARTAAYEKILGNNPDGTRNPAYPVYLDADNYIDYMIVNLYGGNSDWPHKNYYMARDRSADSTGFKFFMWDSEWSLNLQSTVTTDKTGVNTGVAVPYSKLRASAEFRARFADRMQKHFSVGGALYVDPANPAWDPAHPERNVPAARFMEIIEELREALVGESARWGDQHRATPPYTRNAEWQTELNTLLASYFPQRSANVIVQFRTAGLYIDPTVVAAPVFSQPGGTVTAPFVLGLANPGPAGTIYYTLDGSDPRPVGGAATPTGAATAYTGAITLNGSTTVRARVLLANGTWGPLAESTYFIPFTQLRITEVMYNNPVPAGGAYAAGDYDYIELLNTGATAIPLAGVAFTEGIDFAFGGGATLEAGARTLIVKNLAAFRERYGPSPVVAGEFANASHLSDGGETITLRGPAGEVLQSFHYKDGWYPITDGGGYSLVVVEPAGSASLSSSRAWRASALAGGAPGAADPGLTPGTVVVNEVVANAAGPLGDWIELYNTSTSPVDLSGWFLSDSDLDLRKYRIADGTILPAGGFLLFRSLDHFGAAFSLSSTATQVYLSSGDGAGNLAGYREYADFGGSDPEVAFGRHVRSDGESDFVALQCPTPLAANADPLVGPVVISELMYDPIAGAHQFLELLNITAEPVSLAGWTFLTGIDSMFASDASLPAFGRALVVGIDPDVFRTTYAIPSEVSVFGPFVGTFDNGGEDIKLARPGNVLVDKLKYTDELPWPEMPAGGGNSIVRRNPLTYGNDPANWALGNADGTPGTSEAANAPVVDPGGRVVLGQGQALSRIGHFFDPDSSDAWSATVDYGDGPQPLTLAPDQTFILSHTYVSAGMYAVSVSVGDGTAMTVARLDVVVLPAARLGSAAADQWTIRLDPGGQFVQVFENVPLSGTPTFSVPRGDVLSLTLQGGGGADTLVIDLSNGNPIPSGGVTFEGGDGVDIVQVAGSLVPLVASLDAANLGVNGTVMTVGAVEQFQLDGTAGDDSLTVSGSPMLSFNGGAGQDTLHVTGGALTLDSDAGGNTANLHLIASGTATVMLNASQRLASLTLNNTATVTLASGGAKYISTDSLAIAPAAALDLGTHALILRASAETCDAALTATMASLASGYAAGSWIGPGIRTAAATAQRGLGVLRNSDGAGLALYAEFAGVEVDANCILVRFTHNGDSDLNSVLDGDDYFALDAAFLAQYPGMGWWSGDSNYDQRIDIDDYFLIDTAYARSSVPLAAPLGAPMTPASFPDLFGNTPISGDEHNDFDIAPAGVL